MNKILDFIEDNYPTEIRTRWEEGYADALDKIEKICKVENKKVENKDREDVINAQKELIQNQDKIIKTQEEMINELKDMVDKQHTIIGKLYKGVNEIAECVNEEELNI